MKIYLKIQKNVYIFAEYLLYMIIVDISKEKSIETALRTYKNKVQKTKQVQELRDRQVFVKPSVKKRTGKLKAIYIEQKRNGLK